jgi:hypothetical protein
VAIGLETFRRIAQRLGAKAVTDRFAAGHEPHIMTEAGLLQLLNLIAEGEVAISPKIVPLVGLHSAAAVVRNSNLVSLVAAGYEPTTWLKGISDVEFSRRDDLLHFRRW